MNIIISIIFILNLTGSYRIFAALFNFQVAYISATMLSIMICWLFCNYHHVFSFIKNPFTIIALVLIFFWPISTIFFVHEVEIKYLLLQLYYAVLFLSSLLFIKKYKSVFFHKVIFFSYWIAICGLFISFFFPDFFLDVADIVSARTDYYGRGFGFMMQPNMAATNITILFILHSAFRYPSKSIFLSLLIITSYVCAIIITGSRTGIVIMAILAVIKFWFDLKTHLKLTLKSCLIKRSFLTKLFTIGSLLTITSTIALVSMHIIVTHNLIKTHQTGFGLKERIENYLEGKIANSDSITTDENLQARFTFQKKFFEKIEENPFFGYGLGSSKFMVHLGCLSGASHNQYLNYSLEFGVIYSSLFFFFFLGTPLLFKKRIIIEQIYSSNWIFQSCITLLLICLVSNTVLFIRASWILLGFIFFYLHIARLNSNTSFRKTTRLPCV